MVGAADARLAGIRRVVRLVMTDLIQTIARTLGPYVGDEEPDEAHLWAAHNIVTVLGKLGYAIVPREPTREMIKAGSCGGTWPYPSHTWAAMIAAITTGERNG